MPQSAVIFSKGIRRIPALAHFLDEYQLKSGRAWLRPEPDSCVIGWGLRPSTRRARAYAQQHHLPFIALEDGFLRSLGLGVEGYPPFSMVVDDLGIYYDTTRPSRLEQLILRAEQSPELLQQAENAIAQIKQAQLSKYNHAPNFVENRPLARPVVLVLDQTFGDMAVKFGQADTQTFGKMLQTAIAENPEAEIWVKTHPDVISGKKRGYLTNLSEFGDKIRLIAQDCNPLSLLAYAEKVYCVTSQMGFEALLLGKTVVTFGVPWFAGWGLTDDRHPAVGQLQQQQRRAPRAFLTLFAAAYLQYSRYIHPLEARPGTIFDVIRYLDHARQQGERLRGTFYAVGMSLWKRAVVKPFFRFPQCRLRFLSVKQWQKMCRYRRFADKANLLVWGAGNEALLQAAADNGLTVWRLEDGFIRSVGLGSNLVAPLSLVADDVGIYFDATRPSRLEQILQQHIFSASQLAEAEQLHAALLRTNIGKYNVGEQAVGFAKNSAKTILVPGQVEDDASIRLGSPKIKRNLDLLRAVRENNPEAYIVYKPHPDVVSGNRQGAVALADVLRYADAIEENGDILSCIMQVDEVHTMTSLAGFEALLRGKTVHCYGSPFYAHWGLTVDHLELPRRTRNVTLLQLIYAVLIAYPCYIDAQQKRVSNAMFAIQTLSEQKAALKHREIHHSFLRKQYQKLQQLYRSLR